jgi:hypothetical protein
MTYWTTPVTVALSPIAVSQLADMHLPNHLFRVSWNISNVA